MLTTLAFDTAEESLYRQLLEPFNFTTLVVDEYSSSDLDDHLATLHSETTQPQPSGNIADEILLHQQQSGLSSDWVTGGVWMDDIDPVTLFQVKDTSYPGMGGAWLYFTDERLTWGQSITTLSGVTTVRFQFRVSSNNVQMDWGIEDVTDFTESDSVVFINFNSIGSPDPTPRSSSLPDGLAAVGASKYEGNPAFFNEARSSIVANSTSYVRDPAFYVSADAIPGGSEGLFDPLLVANHPTVQNALTHMADPAIHISLIDSSIGKDVTYPSYFIRYSLLPQYYLYNGPTGDAWYDDAGLQSPEINTTPTVYWIAYSTTGGVVRDPDSGDVLAQPVNNTSITRGMFSMPAGAMPNADPGVVLRRLNPDVGFEATIPTPVA